MAVWQWSKVASSNGNSDPTIAEQEGMPPSIVNDSARATMAALADWRDDLSGMLADLGTAGAYVVTSNSGYPVTPTDGTRISFTPANTSIGNDTLQVDGGTAFPVQSPQGTAIGAGVMIALTPYELVFRTAVSAWVLKAIPAGSSLLVPIGGVIDYVGGVSPNSNFALPIGQLLSTTTYANLFALTGYTFGGGGANFRLPDLRGRVVAALDNMGGSAAGRLPAYTSMGANGGQEFITLALANLPATTLPLVGISVSTSITDPGHTHTVNDPTHNHSINDPGHTHTYNVASSAGNQKPAGGGTAPFDTSTGTNTGSNTTGISVLGNGTGITNNSNTTGITANSSASGGHANLNGSGTAIETLPPVMAVNKLIRIL